MKRQKGITLVSLVITIIVLLILAGVALNFAIGKNGIIAKAQEASKEQIISEAKEQIKLDIINAEIEAMERNEELYEAQVENIVSKYGELQSDGDTIILKDSGYKISLLEIYNGNIEVENGNQNQSEIAIIRLKCPVISSSPTASITENVLESPLFKIENNTLICKKDCVVDIYHSGAINSIATYSSYTCRLLLKKNGEVIQTQDKDPVWIMQGTFANIECLEGDMIEFAGYLSGSSANYYGMAVIVAK